MTTPSDTSPDNAVRTVTIDRDLPHPPEKVWRALTEQPLIEQWLLKNDFAPTPGRAFTLRGDPAPNWNGIIECRVLSATPFTTLSYTWGALGLESVVTFTLTPTDSGTHLRMEHSGFGPNQDHAFKGAQYGWKNFLGKLDQLLDQPLALPQ